MNDRTLTAIDLYAGAGGMSLGLSNAGLEVKAAVEIDHWAVETYSKNISDSHIFCEDVSSLDDKFYKKFHGVDVVVGGPPCQGFSICASNRRNKNDDRNRHPLVFLDAVKKLSPKIVVIENVPQILTYKLADGSLLIEKISKELDKLGYSFEVLIVDAAHYGVPQHRKRVFIVGSKLGLVSEFLKPKKKSGNFFSVEDAISDLPEVAPVKVTDKTELRYKLPGQNSYQKKLRQPRSLIKNHVPMRHTKRLIERFEKISINNNGAAVWETHPAKKRGTKKDESGTVFHQNHRRMDPSKPAPTVTAYCYSTFLHPYEDRNLTVREFARLQSFPDYFEFCGPRTSLSKKLLIRKGLEHEIGLNQVNQVGNAVPPILAQSIGEALVKVLKNK